MKENIPKIVLDEATKHRLGEMEYVGTTDNIRVYGEVPEIDENGFAVPTGLPVLILWDGKTAKIVSGEDSLRILSSFD